MSTWLANILHPERSVASAEPETRHPREADQVRFSDLAWDHFQWERCREEPTADLRDCEDRYRETRAAFEARHGEIVDEYWSITEPSGVALTRRKAPLLLRPFIDDVRRFHRATDWVTRDAPPIADVLFACEALAIQVTEALRFTSESVAMRRIVAVASHLLGCLDKAGGKPEPGKAQLIADDQQAELDKIEAYYHEAGVQTGRTVYMQGMLIGLAAVMALAALVVVLAPHVHLFSVHPVKRDQVLRTLLVAYASGAVGAFVSVLQRMASDKYDVHYDLGKRTVLMLGTYRPVLGAVFGVFTYLVLASELLQTTAPTAGRAIYYYGALAFVAGFSERFTRVLVKSVSSATGGGEASSAA
ncbi:MAG TPA: hypothetical protein VLU96_01110 [Gaiellaceae bacterium]|nr:hypothetical protein [Gaiellaceae bacterium]